MSVVTTGPSGVEVTNREKLWEYEDEAKRTGGKEMGEADNNYLI